jgi:excisionase family DNA binding protein
MRRKIMHSNAPSQPVVLRYCEAAKALGVSQRTLWLWTKAGIIPHVRVGLGRRKTILYPLDEIKAWLANQSRTQVDGKKSAK